jgi:hypothetical protein
MENRTEKEPDDPRSPEGPDTSVASQATRDTQLDLNRRLEQWGGKLSTGRWIETRRREGAHLNGEIHWSANDHLRHVFDRESSSVWSLWTDPGTLDENSPEKGQKLPRKRRAKKASDDTDDEWRQGRGVSAAWRSRIE